MQDYMVSSGEDRYGEKRGMGISSLSIKVGTSDTEGALFVVEQAMHEPGGPPRHIHPDQEEWFYVTEGEFLVEIGSRRFPLGPDDSVLAPRGIEHSWAFVGQGTGRIVITFSPAGKMEAFFREVTRANAMPAQDPELWRAHGMQVSGPPLLATQPPRS